VLLFRVVSNDYIKTRAVKTLVFAPLRSSHGRLLLRICNLCTLCRIVSCQWLYPQRLVSGNLQMAFG